MKRRAHTEGNIRDNSIFNIFIEDEFTFKMLDMHYRRQFVTGEVYTGRVRR